MGFLRTSFGRSTKVNQCVTVNVSMFTLATPRKLFLCNNQSIERFVSLLPVDGRNPEKQPLNLIWRCVNFVECVPELNF